VQIDELPLSRYPYRMNTLDTPFIAARLTLSAVFSIAVHASLLLAMAGMVLFPEALFKPATQLEVIIAANPEGDSTERALLEADKNQAGERLSERTDKAGGSAKTTHERRLHTQGNAQWSVKPGIHDETAWQSIRDPQLKHRTVSAASHEARDAEYLARWRDRVEQYGTQYYQSRIKQAPLSGEVRILVSIGPKGQLLEAVVRQSSGQPALDAMAMEIVRKSAPFEPLPEAMRKDTDVLEIIRTWKFTAREGLRAG
jgi:TonB family protein